MEDFGLMKAKLERSKREGKGKTPKISLPWHREKVEKFPFLP